MKLTALEIKQQKFEKAFRGFDPAEVQSFLNVLSNEWEHLTAKNRELEQKIEELRNKIEHYERVEQALHETLEAARETADTKLTGARKEAQHTLEKAEMEAESIVKEAEVEREKVRQGIHRLLDRRKEIVGGLRSYLDVALESVDHFAKDDAGLFELLPEDDKKELISPQSTIRTNSSKEKDKKSTQTPDTKNIDDLVDDLD